MSRPAAPSLPPSPPLGSGSSRQHSASLQQWTQGLVRPPRRATEGSPLSQLRTAQQQQQQRTGATFPRSITHGSGSAQKRHRDAVFLEETDGIVKKDLRDFVVFFLVEEIILPSLLLMMVMISSGYPLLAV